MIGNIIHLLHKHAENDPDRLALIWGSGQSISYSDLAQKIGSLARGFQKLGIEKGDRVLIFLPFGLDLYLSMFAVQHLGAIAVFLDSWARRDQLGLCAQIARPKAMVSSEKAFQLSKEIPEMDQIPIKIAAGPSKEYSIRLEALSGGKKSCPIEPVNPDDTALITFTTGSSGIPKGANRTHHFLAEQHRVLAEVIPYRGDEIDLPVFPIFALNNLASGITTLLPAIDLAAPTAKDGEILAEQIEAYSISCCTLSPSLFMQIAASCRKSLPSLERVVTGGAPIGNDHVERFKTIAPKAEIIILYGSTEVEPISHIEANEMLAYSQTRAQIREGVNVGRISSGLNYKFLKITKEEIDLEKSGWPDWEAEKGKPGELIVSGSHVCEGYYNDEAAFKKAKIRDPNGTIWHRTGDVGTIDEEGYLWFVGRVHNAICRAGQLLFPVHPEMLLKKLPFVRQAAYLGLPDLKLGEKACAIVALQAEIEKNRSFIDKIGDFLKEHRIPADEIKIIDEIPMDPRHHSKVEYSKLAMQLQNE